MDLKAPGIAMNGKSSGSARRLGEILVAEGLITQARLDEALAIQERLASHAPLGHVLVTHKMIGRKRLEAVLERHRKRSRLGEIMVNSGCITREHLDIALAHHRRVGIPLGEALMRLDYTTEQTLRLALCKQLHINFFDLDPIPLHPELRKYVNQKYAAKHLIVPLARVGGTLVVAMDDPTKLGLIEDLEAGVGLAVEVVTSTTASIRRAFTRLYREILPVAPEVADRIILTDPNARALYERLTSEEPTSSGKRLLGPKESHGSETAEEVVRKLINLAIASRASDLHLEAVRHRLQARFRVDGVLEAFDLGALQEAMNQNRSEIIARIKIVSKLDISEKRRPQDGSFRVRAERDGEPLDVDLRVSVIPGLFGENAVLRLLDPSRAPRSLESLGFCEAITTRLTHLLGSSTGMLLVTGPTGSGKSTTLFAALKSIYRPEIKILTAENPIEYVCDEFNQHEINTRLGNTFASYLRAFLRHDPEVIMLGEIRDNETVELAFRAAQTGHLVLSTMHTNDAISAVTRLWDLRVDSNLITSSLIGVLAQRLLREICRDCKDEYTPSDTLLRELFGTPPHDMRWYRGRGCKSCRSTGYKGRLSVGELWTPNDQDVMLINKGAPFEEIRESSLRSTILMNEDVWDKLHQGRTNPEELIRALPYSSLRHLRTTPRPPAVRVAHTNGTAHNPSPLHCAATAD